MGQKLEYEYPNQTFEEPIDKTTYKKIDSGFSFGGGGEYDLGFGLLVGEILVEHGFVDMYDDNFNWNVGEGSNRNTSVTVAFTFLYDIAEIIK